MKRIIMLTAIALSAIATSAVFADTAAPSCHQHCKAAFQHCKTLAKHSDARKACFKKAKADKKACKMHMSKPELNAAPATTSMPAAPAAPQQPATAQ